MNAKEILKHCLERDGAWFEGYDAKAKAPGPMLRSAVGEASGRLADSRFP